MGSLKEAVVRDLEVTRFLDGEDVEAVPPTLRTRAKYRVSYKTAGLIAAVCAIVGFVAWSAKSNAFEHTEEHATIMEFSDAYHKKVSADKNAVKDGKPDRVLAQWGWGQKKNNNKGGKSPAEAAADRQAQQLVNKVKTHYSEPVAEAMAMMVKLTYCGPTPGIFGAAAATCSMVGLPGTTSACERAGFYVNPGWVYTLNGADGSVMDATFGVLTQITPSTTDSALEWGVVLAIRGSVDNYVNSVRDQETTMTKGPEGCDKCKVHEGFSKGYASIQSQLWQYLPMLMCNPGYCTVYVTGLGSGAAIASLAAADLKENGYKIGTSYLYEMPKTGNAAYAKHMNKLFEGTGDDGPVFSVSHGKDSMPRWPFSDGYESWGVEAYYKSVNSTKKHNMCVAGRKGCGTMQYEEDDLESSDTCKNPLPPGLNFCEFHDFNTQCYAGMGFQDYYADVAVETKPAPIETAAKWSPAEADGSQDDALSKEMHQRNHGKPEDFWSEKVLNAMAALVKLSYCGKSPAITSAVQTSCSGSNGPCSKAGFGVVPQSVSAVGVMYESKKTNPYYMANTLFFYTAMIRRTKKEFAKKPYFIPSQACLLVFRGTANKQNMDMNFQLKQISVNDTKCKGCTVNAGLVEAWQDGLVGPVMASLAASGCSPDKKDHVKKVILAGHSMGGTMATMAMYFLHKKGFEIELSWLLEAGRPGNPAFMNYINNEMLADKRLVPFWQTAHLNDRVPRYGRSTFSGSSQGQGRHRWQAYFPSNKTDDVKLCTSMKDYGKNSKCGIYHLKRSDLATSTTGPAHCALPFAPKDNICMLESTQTTDKKLGMSPVCYFGGSIVA